MNIVRELRKKKGIQQKELAIEIGVSQPTVSDWESNKADPSGERLKKLAEFFEVDELVILGKAPYVSRNPNYFIPANPSEVGVSETEQIVRYVLRGLDEQTKSPEIRIVSGMMEKMTKEQQEQVVAVIQAMFRNHPELLD